MPVSEVVRGSLSPGSSGLERITRLLCLSIPIWVLRIKLTSVWLQAHSKDLGHCASSCPSSFLSKSEMTVRPALVMRPGEQVTWWEQLVYGDASSSTLRLHELGQALSVACFPCC